MIEAGFYNMDCMEGMKHIPNRSVDLVLCDLPYGVTEYYWDSILPMDELMKHYRRVCKQNANVLLFCQQPFTTTIMCNIIKSEFSHSLIWKKPNKTRHLSSNFVPMSEYEEILCLRINKYCNKESHLLLRKYFEDQRSESGLSANQLEELIPNKSAHHWFRNSSDYRIPTRQNYARLGAITGLFKRDYEDIKLEFQNEKKNLCTYNPIGTNTNVLEYGLSEKRIHPTQKPVMLLEELILRYSNEGETVLDNAMGSGSTAVACIRNNRNFIGFELDADYFKAASERLAREKATTPLFEPQEIYKQEGLSFDQ